MSTDNSAAIKEQMLGRLAGIDLSGKSKHEIIELLMSSAPGPTAKSAEAGSDSEEGSEAGSEENTTSVSASGVEADGVQSEGSKPHLESAFSSGAKSNVLEGAQTGAEEEIIMSSKQISDEMKKHVDIVDEKNKADIAEKIVPENKETFEKVSQQSDASDVSTSLSLPKKAVSSKSESSEESETTTTNAPPAAKAAAPELPLSDASLHRVHSVLSSEPAQQHPLEESHLPISDHVLASGNVSGNNMSADFQRVDAVMEAHSEHTSAERRAALLEEVVAAGGQIRKRTRMDRNWSGSGVTPMPSLAEAKRAKECEEEERTNKEAGNTTGGDVEMNVDVDAPATGGPNSMGTTTGGGPRLKQITASLAVALSMDEDTVMRTGSLDVHPEVVMENVDVSASPSPTAPPLPFSDAQQEQAEGKSHDSDNAEKTVSDQDIAVQKILSPPPNRVFSTHFSLSRGAPQSCDQPVPAFHDPGATSTGTTTDDRRPPRSLLDNASYAPSTRQNGVVLSSPPEAQKNSGASANGKGQMGEKFENPTHTPTPYVRDVR